MILETAVDRSFVLATSYGRHGFSFDQSHLQSEAAMRPPAPRSPRHAALLVLAGMSLPRPRVLPGTPIPALAGAFNYRF
ncbi:MAG: hypothetical protein LBH10_05955 [Burkholderiaceae bacterium]|jgi:hypothetical protein|nr:hypothetical protein [Burkholderiaceae bacterium]